MKVYKVQGFSLGEKHKADQIRFGSLKDMEAAYKDIDNGRDIYVETEDGVVTKILNQAITSKIYEATITLCATRQKDERVEGEE